MRAPAWVSTRRLFEQKLLELPNCTDLSHVKQVHAQIIKQNLHEDLYIAPKLISAFSLCHHMKLALSVFNQVRHPNVYMYNTLIRAHVHSSQPSMAFATLLQMQQNDLFPDNFTYPFLLKACSAEPWLPMVQMIHGSVQKFGFFGDIFVPNSLIDSYCKCGVFGIRSAMKLFRRMEKKDIVSWNTMIGGLVRAGDLRGAHKLFDEMPVRDSISWNTMLDAFVKAGEMNEAFELFQNMPNRNVVSWSTMVSGYTKAGDIEMARMLFDKMPSRNLVPWTIIISGYAQMGQAQEAVRLYDLMEKCGLVLDSGAAISILAACAESGLLCLGNRVHASILLSTRLECRIEVCNALIDMYAKCGMVKKAYEVFKQMAMTDLVSWNCMLQGLAVHGHGDIALELFSRMKQEGFKPDKITLVAVLCACTHAGFINKGLGYFHNMEREYGISPSIEHYGCVVDLLGRAGLLRDAFRLVKSMPMEPNAVIWGTLLGACRMHNEVELAKKVQDQMADSERSEHGNGSMLSNIFAAAGDWMNVANVRLQMKSAGIQKPSGASSIEVDDEVHEFTVLDKSHPESDKVYETIDALIEELRLIADTTIDHQLSY
ncbi:Pentatricopeptide repeat-containing protein At3g29230 [Linum perenne]